MSLLMSVCRLYANAKPIFIHSRTVLRQFYVSFRIDGFGDEDVVTFQS